MKTTTFACKECGCEVERPLKHMRRAGRFCSPRCYYRWKPKNPTPNPTAIPCPICQKDFLPYGKQRTCSMKCKLEKGFKKRRRTCVTCGNNFETTRPAAPNKYCSNKCFVASIRLPKTELDCPQCGKHVVRATVRTRPRKFCSDECRKLYMRGENSHMFRGGNRAYRGSNWTQQAALARARDGGWCQGCGAPHSVEKASVDHIVPFRLTKIYADKDQKDPNDLANLICLCRKCHARKTSAEVKLLKGDVIGFLTAVNIFMPIQKVEQALSFWGLL